MSKNAARQRHLKRVHRAEFSAGGGYEYLNDVIAMITPHQTPSLDFLGLFTSPSLTKADTDRAMLALRDSPNG